MATDFTGTDSEKIDKLIVTIIELRTTLRICFAIIGVGFPTMIGLLSFLVVQSFSTSAKVDSITDQIAIVKVDYSRISERLERREKASHP